nr:hypothetical protein [Tanacetum cinerariifolium]
MSKRCTVDDDLNEKLKDHTTRRNLNQITASSTQIHREETKSKKTYNTASATLMYAVMIQDRFWSTAMAKTINGEAHIHARVDRKEIIINESFVRRDRQLADEEDEAVHKELGDRLMRVATTASSLEVERDSEQEVVSTAATTKIITAEEITLAQALEALKPLKPKAKGIVFQEPGKSTTTTTTKITPTISLQHSHDKGKGIMIEEPMKPKKKYHIRLDEEVALKLQAEFDEEERITRERAEKEQEANITLIETYDDIQAKMISFKRVNTFKDIRTELVKGKEKRVGEELIQDSTKKQKEEDDKEKAELKYLMKTIPDEEEVVIDVIPLAVKSPRIVDLKIHEEVKKLLSNCESRWKVSDKMKYGRGNKDTKCWNEREDLEYLYKLVKARYGSTRPV